MNNEIWRDVPGFAGKYRVSNLGAVLSLVNAKCKGGYIKKPQKRKDGYLQIILKVEQKSICRLVHTIVADAFLGARPSGCVVNHKDGNKENNAAENLEWCTQKENVRHANRTGLRRVNPDGHRFAKLSAADVRLIRQRIQSSFNGVRFSRGALGLLADEFQVKPATIAAIAHGKTWKGIA